MRRAFLPPIMILVIVGSFPAQAVAETRELSAKQSTISFWRYSKCLVDRSEKSALEVIAWLTSYYDDPTDEKHANAQRIAQRYGGCAMPGDKMKFDEGLFLGTLAGIMFLKKHEGQPLPDYSAAPRQYTTAQFLMMTGNAEQKNRYFSLIFAECVFRNRPNEIRALLDTKPYSNDADAVWEQIQPVMSGCLPVEEGTELRFSRAGLRAHLGEAAYRVDEQLPVAEPLGDDDA